MDPKMNEMKKPFISPKVEVIVFDCEDVITTSGVRGGFEGEWDENIPEVDL